MRLTQKFYDYVLAIMLGIVAGTGLFSTVTAFGNSYGVLWFFGFIISLIWTLHKIK